MQSIITPFSVSSTTNPHEFPRMPTIVTVFFFNHKFTRIFTYILEGIIRGNSWLTTTVLFANTNRYGILFQPQIYTDFHKCLPEGIIRVDL